MLIRVLLSVAGSPSYSLTRLCDAEVDIDLHTFEFCGGLSSCRGVSKRPDYWASSTENQKHG